MATLVSPGVSVTVTDQSFYIPASAPTVPLIFVATNAGKFQPNGITAAAGTAEHDIVRTVTSIGQSVQLYGIPNFRKDVSNNQFNGDARNEYGLFALNQYLGIGNLAYVIRANIDLADAAVSFIGIGTPTAGAVTLVGVGNGTLSSIMTTSAMVRPETIDVIMTSATAFTVQGSVSGIIGAGTVGVPFSSSITNFTLNAGSTAFVAGDYFQYTLVYSPSSFTGVGTGKMTAITMLASAVAETISVIFTTATAFSVSGSLSGPMGNGTVGTVFSDVGAHISFFISAGTTAFVAADEFQLTLTQVKQVNLLGANDAAKRVAITTALAASININSDIRSESYEYNLILCPGYPEVVTDLIALSQEISDEAFVIADTPSDLTAEQVTAWSKSMARFNSTSVGYYYPWGQAANLDGALVVCAASGIALRTYAYSDNHAYVWFAPAGTSRGLVTGVTAVGYVSGALGTANTFVQSALNQGQRDGLYEDFANINPIVYFPGQGIIIWGQKTSAPAASSLDRVNVSRLLMYIKRALRKGAMPFVFEPNDQITRNNLKAMADGFLNQILAKRGLTDFVTLCDASNNPPAAIDNNQLYMDVAIIPERAAEFIYIPIVVLATGATLPS